MLERGRWRGGVGKSEGERGRKRDKERGMGERGGR